MMNELIDAVTALVGEETQRAKEQYGEKYASLHEGYGVLVEEIDEVGEDMEKIEDGLLRILRYIRKNDWGAVGDWLSFIQQDAINAACECIQVAAVARKMKEGM